MRERLGRVVAWWLLLAVLLGESAAAARQPEHLSRKLLSDRRRLADSGGAIKSETRPLISQPNQKLSDSSSLPHIGLTKTQPFIPGAVAQRGLPQSAVVKGRLAEGGQQTGFGGFPGSRQIPHLPTAGSGDTQNRLLAVNTPCEANVRVTQPWGCAQNATTGNTIYCSVFSFFFKNWGNQPILVPWNMTVNNPNLLGVRDVWNFEVTGSAPGVVTGQAVQGWQVLQPGGASTPSMGGTFTGTTASSTEMVPADISVNGLRCSVVVVSGQGDPATTAAPFNAPPAVPVAPVYPPPMEATLPLASPPPLPPAPPAPPSPPPPPPRSFPGGKFAFPQPPKIVRPVGIDGIGLVGVDNKPLVLNGINWFGFEDGNTAPDGIWAGTTALSRDVATIIRRMKLLGFNAVRLPFSMADLFNLAPRDFNWLCAEVTDDVLLKATTNPNVTIPNGLEYNITLPFQPQHAPGSCDDYLPSSSTFARFIFVVNLLTRNGLYVLLDNHSNFDSTIVQNYDAWLLGWKRIMSTIALDPISKAHVMYDILNEPDSINLGWDFMTDAYLQVIEQGQAINPDAVYFVEGCGQGLLGSNWGDGFATTPALITPGSPNDPTRFFDTVVANNYSVVVSPHVYPPTITHATTRYSGLDLFARLSISHGYLNQEPGYCNPLVPGACKTFPVIPGEFGSRLTDPRDLQSLADYALYLKNTGAGVDGKHSAMPGWFWWAWNANSGDTGGIVDDDWVTILWNKIDYLSTVGLRTWDVQFFGAQPTPLPRSETTSAPTAAPAAAVTDAPTHAPTPAPTFATIPQITLAPTVAPLTKAPTAATASKLPTAAPTAAAVTAAPTAAAATEAPIAAPTVATIPQITLPPTDMPTDVPQTGGFRPTAAEATAAPVAPTTAAPTVPLFGLPTEAPLTEAPTTTPRTAGPTADLPIDAPTAAPVATTSAPVGDGSLRTLATWAQCGGISACPAGATCADATWTGVQCQPGVDECVRQDAYYRQCKPIATAAPTAFTPSGDRAIWSQCGGKSNCPAGQSCSDAAWPAQCAPTDSCVRQSEWYWQCLPASSRRRLLHADVVQHI